MIPRTEIRVKPEIPPEAIFWTPTREDLSEEGFGGFRDTWLIRGVAVSLARDVIDEEARLASLAAQLAQSPEEFDELASALESMDLDAVPERLRDEPTLARISSLIGEGNERSQLESLELGVAGVVHALSSVGCWPAASCRGHPGAQAWSSHPVVFLAAEEHRGRALAECVGSVGCGLGVDPIRRLISIEAPSILEMMELARAILDRRLMFVRPKPRNQQGVAPVDQLSLLEEP